MCIRDRDIRTMPALNASPRSTLGTTRTIAYSNGLRAAGAPATSAAPVSAAASAAPATPATPGVASGDAGTLGLLDERSRRAQPRDQIVHVGPAMRIRVR